jgi:O-antigen/teichoic acid export membrane protein
MNSRHQQVRNSLMYLLPVIIGSAIPLATLPIYTRALAREEYGAWALALAYASFVTGLANFGLTLGYERNFFENREGKRPAQLLYTTLAFVLAAFAACAVVTWIFRRPIASAIVGSESRGPLLVCTMCAHAVMSLKTYYLTFFRNTGQARAHVWYSVDELVGASVLGVIFVAWLRVGVIGIPLGQLVASVVVVSALTWRFVRELPVSFSTALLKEELAISYPLAPRILVGVAGSQIDKYLLRLFSSVAGVGVYSVGQRLAQIVFAYMTALENVFGPQVYQRMFHGGPDGGRSIGSYLTPFAYLSTLAALGLGLFAEEALVVLTRPEYYGAIPIAGILCLHYAIMFFGKMPQLMYARKSGLISVLTFVSLGLNAAFNLVFIRRWDAVGAAAGTLVAGTLSIAIALVVGQRYYRIQWQYAALAWIFGVLFAGVILTIWLHDAGVGYVPRLAVKGATLGLYAVVGVQLGIISRQNFGLARDALQRKLAVPTA